MNNIEKFDKWYRRFLKLADPTISDELTAKEAQRVSGMIPVDAICNVAESNKCKFCADEENANVAEYYGLTDLGHETPKDRTEKVVGMKSGSVLPLAVRCCKKCRRNFLVAQYLPTLLGLVIVIATLIIVQLPAVKADILSSDFIVPPLMRSFCIFVVVLALTVLACAVLRRLLIEKLSSKTAFSIFDVDGLRVLKPIGWFPLYKNKHFSQVMFTKKRPKYMNLDENMTNPDAPENAPEGSNVTESVSQGDNATESVPQDSGEPESAPEGSNEAENVPKTQINETE